MQDCAPQTSGRTGIWANGHPQLYAAWKSPVVVRAMRNEPRPAQSETSFPRKPSQYDAMHSCVYLSDNTLLGRDKKVSQHGTGEYLQAMCGSFIPQMT